MALGYTGLAANLSDMKGEMLQVLQQVCNRTLIGVMSANQRYLGDKAWPPLDMGKI